MVGRMTLPSILPALFVFYHDQVDSKPSLYHIHFLINVLCICSNKIESDLNGYICYESCGFHSYCL